MYVLRFGISIASYNTHKQVIYCASTCEDNTRLLVLKHTNIRKIFTAEPEIGEKLMTSFILYVYIHLC